MLSAHKRITDAAAVVKNKVSNQDRAFNIHNSTRMKINVLFRWRKRWVLHYRVKAQILKQGLRE